MGLFEAGKTVLQDASVVDEVVRFGFHGCFANVAALELANVCEVLLFEIALEVEVVAEEEDFALEEGHVCGRFGHGAEGW